MSLTTRPLQVRLLVAIIGLTAVFFSILGWISVDRISELTRETVHTKALDVVALRGQEIESFFREHARVADTMLRTPSFRDFFVGYDTSRQALEDDIKYDRLDALFHSVVDSNDRITSAFFATENTGEYFRESGRVEREGYDPKTRWWWAEALKKDRLYVRSPGIDAGTGEIIVTVQTTVTLDDGRFLGVGGIDVTLGSLGDLVGKITYKGVGDAFLVDHMGQIIYFPGVGPNGSSLEKFSTKLEEVESLSTGSEGFSDLAERLKKREPGLDRVRWHDQDLIVVHTPVRATSPDFEWTLGLMVPEEIITAAISHARWTTALAVLIAIGAIASATLFVSHRISQQLRVEDRHKAEILAEANLTLLEADRMKSHFLATMSHELRTPLNSIIGFAQILASRLDGKIDAVFVKFLNNIHSSGQHLLTMISDILDLSKVEAGKMELEAEFVDVEDVVNGVCSVVHGIARERHLTFDIDIEDGLPRIEADLVRVKQILFNLLSNAVKFSADGGVITIVVRQLAIEKSSLGAPSIEITVIDRGIGISENDQKIIFDEFRQAESAGDSKAGGTGLGLALVKKLVELHLGTISVDSNTGDGSAFRVVLPRRFQCAESTGVFFSEAPLPKPRGRYILVVEDDTTAYQIISRSLASAGYIPERSPTGEDALELAIKLDAIAIVLDIILPRKDGWEVLRELKNHDETRHIPVIMVSVLANHELGLALGADAYFSKPIDRALLLGTLGKLTGNQNVNGQSVLIIDDDERVHELLQEILAPAGFSVNCAISGQQGLSIAKTQPPPNIIVLDLMMEKMDGYEVARELKLDPRTRHIPVVIFTAMHPSRSKREQLRGKIEALVHKAASPGSPDLLPVLNDVIGRNEL